MMDRASGLPLLSGRDPADRRRIAELEEMAVAMAVGDFEERHGDMEFAPVVALLASYLEAKNIGSVLEKMPFEACGLAVSTLVVIDGGDDGTEEIAAAHGASWVKLPVNMGQGVALKVGYDLALARGARFVVTIDADGQNDPGELPDLLAALVEDRADFVVASRVLGVDETSDRVRRVGVRVFAAVINFLIAKHLTDTSNGYSALRSEVLRSVSLEQSQYQTAELIISAAARGFGIVECPTVWHPRTSGFSKKGRNLTFALNYARVIAATAWRERRGLVSLRRAGRYAG